MKKTISFILIISLLFFSTPRSSADSATQINNAINYLTNNFSAQGAANQDWAGMALATAGNITNAPNLSDSSLLSLDRNVLAKASQKQATGSEVAQIEQSYSNNQFGDPVLINDDIFSILAIQAADPSWLTIHQEVFDTIINTQRPDGSFNFTKNGDGGADMTAAAIWALRYKTQYPSAVINKAVAYLASLQTSDGGFAAAPQNPSNIATTSWVILAYNSLGINGQSAKNYLLNNQQVNGAWLQAGNPNYLNTAYAVMALSGSKMPVVFTPKPAPISTPVQPSNPGHPTSPTASNSNPSQAPSANNNPSSATNNSGTSSAPKKVSTPAKKVVKKVTTYTYYYPTCSASASASATGSSSSASASASCN